MTLRSTLACFVVAVTSGCATTTSSDTACPDISGTYRNPSDAAGPRLSEVLAHIDSDAPVVAIATASDGNSIALNIRGERKLLYKEKDFTCSAGKVHLTEPIRTGSSLPPLASTQETTQFSLAMRGSQLVGHRRVTTSAVAYGVPLRGPTRSEADVVWNTAKP